MCGSSTDMTAESRCTLRFFLLGLAQREGFRYTTCVLNRFFGVFSQDLGIDLGTANTLVYQRGKGIVINEPSVARPRVVIGIPSGVTEVERRAVEDAAMRAGARQEFLIEEPMAAAIGSRLPVQDAAGNLIVDIGGGTTEVAVISLGGVVVSRSIRIAGDELNEDIIRFARDEFNLLLGERTAEEIKITIGSAWELADPLEMPMRGRDLVTGLPKEVMVNDAQIRQALSRSTKIIVNHVKTTVEETPPELLADYRGAARGSRSRTGSGHRALTIRRHGPHVVQNIPSWSTWYGARHCCIACRMVTGTARHCANAIRASGTHRVAYGQRRRRHTLVFSPSGRINARHPRIERRNCATARRACAQRKH
ncbi:MAG: rod shape-determining protein MreB [Parcubacteria group bacterium Gr01-1014_106]|nr:MAG: rod shape-determining protein MreB [Parcubacteria group bacterium Gr01-1014_106]